MSLTRRGFAAATIAAGLSPAACAPLHQMEDPGIAPAGGEIIYVSRRAARAVEGAPAAPGDFEAQLREAFENLNAAIEDAGGRSSHVDRMNNLCASTARSARRITVLDLHDIYSSADSPPGVLLAWVCRPAHAT